ncbi:hypothetical protein SDRG_08618 [Saprolegnia diclina VS20]|uniref:Transmembrane protein n=1 Tax=Saprolegnia diclina (strain VS20) TaxID=1156394 RepID=T0RU56_SAPDV|nr:hypothetical protein SDRG_08618 [Saprolegnia diclina VS20]EQC33937.1 hypothetical protein SDRG_08618 [Saprolegnia diclina VS20]|eukprot:XP_008612732.1 hypothetical protein SDRG_08618 [Saprolegnia diclina VS20]
MREGRVKTVYILSDEEDAAVDFAAAAETPPGAWKTPLFTNACADTPNLAMAVCCPCVALGKVLAIVGVMSCKRAVVASGLWLLLLLLAILNLQSETPWPGGPGGAYSVGFVVVLALVPSLTLFNLRFHIRDHDSIPKADWEDVCCAIWCFPFVLAQMTIQVEANTPGECDFEDNATLIAYSTA